MFVWIFHIVLLAERTNYKLQHEDRKVEAGQDKPKPSTVLLNTTFCVSGIVDQVALFKALKEGKIFGAGLDVMTPEPLPADSPLLSLPNCGEYHPVYC